MDLSNETAGGNLGGFSLGPRVRLVYNLLMRICFFGESYVNRIGDPTFQGWVGRLCEITRAKGNDITSYNCGFRGATSDLIAQTWLREAKSRLTNMEKSAVVFSYGTNNCWRKNDAP